MKLNGCIVWLSLFGLMFSGNIFADQNPPVSSAVPAYAPTSSYTVRNIYGWNCYIANDLIEDSELDAKTNDMLELQLKQITFIVPPEALKKIQTVKIWIQKEGAKSSAACFHVSSDWLKQNGFNPDKIQSVDIASASEMLREYDRQPMLIFHELAHAYHFLFLEQGFGNPDVALAYKNAMEAKRYDKVLCFWQTEERAHAATNPMEYFTELSECYFGENDFYPFVKTEFRKHDTEGFQMIEKMWGINQPAGKK